jgi:hypothetical protein
MRRRAIKPEFWLDEGLAELPRDARLFYIGLWNAADGWGILEDRPRRIAAALFPYDRDITDQTISDWIDLLVSSRHLVRYQAAGKALIWIRNLRRHQQASMPKEERERKATLPLPPEAGSCDGAPRITDVGATMVPPRCHVGTSAGNRVIGETGNRGDGSPSLPSPSLGTQAEALDPLLVALQELGCPVSRDDYRSEWRAATAGYTVEQVVAIIKAARAEGNPAIWPSQFKDAKANWRPPVTAESRAAERATKIRDGVKLYRSERRHWEAQGKSPEWLEENLPLIIRKSLSADIYEEVLRLMKNDSVTAS